MGDFTKLTVWQKSHELTIKMYDFTKKLSPDENFGLKSQIRRAIVSCESDIAEGETRYTTPSKINFFVDARASLAEVQTQLMIIKDVYPELRIEANDLLNECQILSKQLNSLISYRRNSYLKTQSPNNQIT